MSHSDPSQPSPCLWLIRDQGHAAAINPPLHIWWGLSSQPVAYESVPRDFLSPGWDQLSSPSSCPPPLLPYSMKDLFGAKVVHSSSEAGGLCVRGGHQLTRGQCTYTHRIQMLRVEPGPSRGPQLQLHPHLCSPVACRPPRALLQLLGQFLLLTILYTKLSKFSFCNTKAGPGLGGLIFPRYRMNE